MYLFMKSSCAGAICVKTWIPIPRPISVDVSVRLAYQNIIIFCGVHLDLLLNVHRWEYQVCLSGNQYQLLCPSWCPSQCTSMRVSGLPESESEYQSLLLCPSECTIDPLHRCTLSMHLHCVDCLWCWHLHSQCSIAISMLFSIQNMAFMCLQFVQIQPLEQSPYWIWMCDCALRFISCVQVLDTRSVLRKRWSWASTLTAIFLQSLLCDCECEYQNQMHPTCSDPSASRVHPLVCNHDSTRITSWTVILLDNQFIRVNDIPLEGKCLQNTKFKETYWC